MPKRSRDHIEEWPETVTSQDVITFALARFARHVAKWGLACVGHDEAAMIRAVAMIRNIANSMERFRRITVKRWQAAAPANSQTEQKTECK
jgi:hypothetical protein